MSLAFSTSQKESQLPSVPVILKPINTKISNTEQLPNQQYLKEIEISKSAAISNGAGLTDACAINYKNPDIAVPLSTATPNLASTLRTANVDHNRECFVLSPSESDIENSVKRNSMLIKFEHLSRKWRLKMPAFKSKKIEIQDLLPKPAIAINVPDEIHHKTPSNTSIKLKENELEYSDSIHSRSSEEDTAMLTIFEKLLRVFQWKGKHHSPRYHSISRVDSNEIENRITREKELSYFERISAVLHRNRLTRESSTNTSAAIRAPVAERNTVKHAEVF